MASVASSAPEILIAHVAAATTHAARRLRRHHAAQPHAAARRRGVPHARGAASRAASTWASAARPAPIPPRRVRCGRSTPREFPNQVRELRALSERAFPAGPPVCLGARGAAGRGAAADLGAGLERRDGRLRRIAGARLRVRPALQPDAARARPSAPTARRSGPRRSFPQPHVILGVSVMCAPTDEEADYLTTSSDLGWLRLHRREFSPLPSPEEARAYDYSPQERVVVEMNRLRHFIGTPPKVVSLIRQVSGRRAGRRGDGDVDDLRPCRAAALLRAAGTLSGDCLARRAPGSRLQAPGSWTVRAPSPLNGNILKNCRKKTAATT